MQLRQYIKESGIKRSQIAKKMNISEGTMNRLLHGHDISLSVALKLERITGGAVTIYEILDWTKVSKRLRSEKNKRKKKTVSKNDCNESV